MAKSAKKRARQGTAARKKKKAGARPEKAAEYVSCLLELHKLQGVLLTHLEREV